MQFLPDGRLLARFDCNQGRGGYTAAEGVLALTPLAVTTAMCPPDSADTDVPALLERATSYRFDPEVGALCCGGRKACVQLQPALTGVVWQWQDNSAAPAMSPCARMTRRQYTVEFLPDGTLAIQADCNHATGTYTVTARSSTCRSTGVTTPVCPPGALTDRFLRDLDQVTSHVFRDGKLYLALPMDAGILAFAPTSLAPAAATPAAG